MQSLFVLFSSVYCIAGASAEYNMPPLNFVFSKEQNGSIKDYHDNVPSSYWSIYNGMYTVSIYLEHLLTNDELSVFLSGIIIHIAPHIDKNTAENIWVRLNFNRELLLFDILKESNLRKIEMNFSKNNRDVLENFIKSHTVVIEWDDDYEEYILKMKIPQKSSEKIYIKAFVYSMKTINALFDDYLKNPESFLADDVRKSIVEDAVIVCKVLSLRMLIRTLIEPNLFTREEKQVIFHTIRNFDEQGLKELVEKYPTTAFSSTYACPIEWEKVITMMSYSQLIQALLNELDSVFPERKAIMKD